MERSKRDHGRREQGRRQANESTGLVGLGERQVEDDSLPIDLQSMSVGGTEQPRNPQKMGAIGGPRSTPTEIDHRLRVDGQQLDYNGDNGQGGVCASKPPADLPPSPSPAPAPLIPDQPAAPGAPAALAAAMGSPLPAADDLSTPSTGLSTGTGGIAGISRSSVQQSKQPVDPFAAVTASRTPTPDSAEAPRAAAPSRPTSPAKPAVGPAAQKPEVRTIPTGAGRRPKTNAEIAEFADNWLNPAFTVRQVADAYGVAALSTIRAWRVAFGLPEHPLPVKDAVDGQLMPFANQLLNEPHKDPEIMEAVRDVLAEARMMTSHSDAQVLQRKLTRITVIAAAKMPLRSWEGVVATFDSLSKSTLHMRRVEAEIPRGDVDPVALRQEAASILFKEMKSVLTDEEQGILADVVQKASDRLMARGGDHASVTASVEVDK